MSDDVPAPRSEPNQQSLLAAPQWLKTLSVGSICLLGLVLVGFLRGITEPHAAVRASVKATLRTHGSNPETQTSVPNARSYRELPESSLSPNSSWTSDFTRLKTQKPGLFDPVVRTNSMKQTALVDRSRTRAFDGAPPVIPHKVEQQSASSCLTCHREGLLLGDKVATRLSHATFTSCTQCHVEAISSGPLEDVPLAANTFIGQDRSGPGDRAMLGSPPTIPHSTFLREDCLSCHGLIARPRLRTTHPWLSNCRQCHAAGDEVPASFTFLTEPAGGTKGR